MSRRRLSSPVSGVLLALLCVWPCGAAAAGWAGPDVIFTSKGHVDRPMALLADSAGCLHVFFSDGPTVGRPTALVYARRCDEAWSSPVKLFAPGGTVAFPSAALDERGTVHLLYEGPRYDQLEYRSVPVSRAGDPEAWTKPQAMSPGGVFLSAIVATPGGVLNVAYADRQGDVFFRRSTDRGDSWTAPLQVSQVAPGKAASDAVGMAVDGRGRLHLTWTEFALPNGWPPLGGFYSRSSDGGQTWERPLRVTGENRGLVAVAAHGNDEVHLAWNSVVQLGERSHSWSRDGGGTWTAPVLITQSVRGGWTGSPGLAFDSAGVLHLVTAVDGPADVERVVYLRWNGSAWSEPELISDGAAAIDSREFPHLAISNGNRLHVVCEADLTRLWYTERSVEAPPIPPVAVPTPVSAVRSILESPTRFRRLLLGLSVFCALTWTGIWLGVRLVRRRRN